MSMIESYLAAREAPLDENGHLNITAWMDIQSPDRLRLAVVRAYKELGYHGSIVLEDPTEEDLEDDYELGAEFYRQMVIMLYEDLADGMVARGLLEVDGITAEGDISHRITEHGATLLSLQERESWQTH